MYFGFTLESSGVSLRLLCLVTLTEATDQFALLCYVFNVSALTPSCQEL